MAGRAISRAAGLVLAVAVLGAAGPGAAEARWRVVGPGIAVGGADEGRASLAIECGDGLEIAAYGLQRDFPAAAPLTLEVDGARFDLSAKGGRTRVALSGDGGVAGVPPQLLQLLRTAKAVTLSGESLGEVPEAERRFSLRGSGDAIATIERGCR